MPKKARSQADIETFREKILDEALSIISDHGFKYFSMRKLASRLGMTATTIYNYYSNKDELYLMILTKGFDELVTTFKRIESTNDDPLEKIKRIVRAYVEFGIKKSHYYNIMFTSDAPKYLDYVGTTIEPVAYFEKNTAVQLIEITSSVARKIMRGNDIPEETMKLLIFRIWSSLHGIITLYNSRVLHEVEENPDAMLEKMVDTIIVSFQELFMRLGKADTSTRAITMAVS
ncbi:MAG: TetR/AcrR family transcriptional regulator [Desulfomonilia bacterium]|jgi:AcrR family transcriptional regulator